MKSCNWYSWTHPVGYDFIVGIVFNYKCSEHFSISSFTSTHFFLIDEVLLSKWWTVYKIKCMKITLYPSRALCTNCDISVKTSSWEASWLKTLSNVKGYFCPDEQHQRMKLCLTSHVVFQKTYKNCETWKKSVTEKAFKSMHLYHSEPVQCLGRELPLM